jgi:hypothetical protein
MLGVRYFFPSILFSFFLFFLFFSLLIIFVFLLFFFFFFLPVAGEEEPQSHSVDELFSKKTVRAPPINPHMKKSIRSHEDIIKKAKTKRMKSVTLPVTFFLSHFLFSQAKGNLKSRE